MKTCKHESIRKSEIDDWSRCLEQGQDKGANKFKALYRRAKAFRLMQDFEKASSDPSGAEELCTSIRTSYIQKERKDLQTAISLFAMS